MVADDQKMVFVGSTTNFIWDWLVLIAGVTMALVGSTGQPSVFSILHHRATFFTVFTKRRRS